MSKLSSFAIAIAFFLCLLALSRATDPLYDSRSIIADNHHSPEPIKTIFLPTEKPVPTSDAATTADVVEVVQDNLHNEAEHGTLPQTYNFDGAATTTDDVAAFTHEDERGTILLTEKSMPTYDAATAVDMAESTHDQSHTENEQGTLPQTEQPIPTSDSVEIAHGNRHTEYQPGTIPRTSLNFHPINRHFPRSHGYFPFRPGHRCGHHWNPRLKADRHRTPRNVILSQERWGFTYDPELHRVNLNRRVPSRWARMYNGNLRFPQRMDLRWPSEDSYVKKRNHRTSNTEERKEKQNHPDIEATKESAPAGSGILTNVRKFLGQF